MRPKLQKSYRRTMHSYALSFGFRPPYQVLLDATFLKAAVPVKVDIEKSIGDILQNTTKYYVTECTLRELDDRVAFEKRRCGHFKSPLSSTDCIKELVGSDNKHNYIVATTNVDLRAELRKVPGVPILHINDKSNLVVMEPMSTVTKLEIKKRETEKLLPPPKEKEKIQTAKLIKGEAPQPDGQQKPAKKRKGVKQPNPLSVKKSQKIPPPPPKKKKKQRSESPQPSSQKRKIDQVDNHSESSTTEKKRRRRKKKKTAEKGSADSNSNNNTSAAAQGSSDSNSDS